MSLLEILKGMRPPSRTSQGRELPDPALPPANRGDWDDAALTNIDITEKVKREIRTTTLPWQK